MRFEIFESMQQKSVLHVCRQTCLERPNCQDEDARGRNILHHTDVPRRD